MFNIGLKRDTKKKERLLQSRFGSRFVRGQEEQMTGQVKKILEQKGQGLIVMVRG